MSKIAISYRRSDSQDITGRIFDRLALHFGKETVFRDIDNIRPGIDFRKQIADALRTTDVLLVVVGPKWLGLEEGEAARIENEADPVRIEVETALARDIPVIPVLVGGCKMPTTNALPGGLKEFAYRHAVNVDSGRDFDHHIAGLVRALDDLFLAQKAEAEAEAKDEPARETRPITEGVTTRPTSPSPPATEPSPLRGFGLIVGLVVAGLALVAVLALRQFSAPSGLQAPAQVAVDPPKPTDTPAATPTPRAPSSADDFAVLFDKAKAGDTAAAKSIEAAAEINNIWAMQQLAKLYDDGLAGFPKDQAKYKDWLSRAAEAGNGSAMQVVAYKYQTGDRGFPRDPQKALEWLIKSANAGDLWGMYNLAQGYLKDFAALGLTGPDLEKGARWYLAAVKAGMGVAAYDLIEDKGHWIGAGGAGTEASRKAIVDFMRSANLYDGPPYDGKADFDPSILDALSKFKQGTASLPPEKSPPPPSHVVPPFPVALGDAYENVRTALNTHEVAKPYVTEGETGQTELDLTSRGIEIFFDSSKKVYAVNFHRPFAGSVWGVKIGDSKDDVKKRLGEPAKPGSDESRFYYYGQVVVDFDPSNHVAALIF